MSKEIKNLLKDVREHIRNKDFQCAVIKCEKILKHDSDNYMALVFMGAAYQEIDKKQAVIYLQKAVSCSSDPTLALVGLANVAETNELPEIYEKLLKLLPEKYEDYYSKLVDISEDESIWQRCLGIFDSEIAKNPVVPKLEHALRSVTDICLKQSYIPDKWTTLFVSALDFSVKYYNQNDILDNLYKLKMFDLLLKYCCEFHEENSASIYPLEWICKAYAEEENFAHNEYVLKKPIDYYIDGLLSIKKNSVIALFAKAIRLYNMEQYNKARDLFFQIDKTQRNKSLCNKYLSNCHYKIGAWDLAVKEFEKLNLNPYPLEYIESLAFGNTIQSWKQARNICQELLSATDNVESLYNKQGHRILICLARSYYSLKQEKLVYETLDKLKMLNKEAAEYLILEFIREPSEAATVLESIEEDCFDKHFLLAKKLFEIGNFEQSINLIVRCINKKPYYSECFLWLGKIYKVNKDWNNAIKGFERCIQLNPRNQDAVYNLISIYEIKNYWEENLNLLQNILNYYHGAESKWVIFQKGQHYHKLRKFDQAIESFRLAIRLDAEDVICWENLADSYFQRGSFNSAMRIFQKVLDVNPTNPYPKFQIAMIKSMLKLFAESFQCFDELLEKHPDYLLGLKGAAETHYKVAKDLLAQMLVGRCKDHLQMAVDYLQKALLMENKNIAVLWNLLANVFVTAACLPKEYAFIKVSGKLAGQEEDIITLDGKDLFELSGRYYLHIIKQDPSNASLWYELALNYYYYAQIYSCKKTKNERLMLARDALRQSIKIQPERWQDWNLLGILYTIKENEDIPLAQHCFIKALQFEKQSSICWTNLGVMYLSQGQDILANKAFSRAQQFDTSFVNAWIGQAIIAENREQEEDALDLFRHCTQLAYHPESALGYTHWVCKTLSDSKKMKDPYYMYTIENMHALPIAFDSIKWYTISQSSKLSVESISYLGYLCWKQSLQKLAIEAFKMAVLLAKDEDRDQMYCNLGYSYLKHQQPLEAIRAFNNVSAASLKSVYGLATAQYRASQYQDSYEVFTSALEWLANTDEEKAAILFAMSAIVYTAQGESDSKNIILQCISLAKAPIQAMYSAGSLGILHSDPQLSEAILDKLKNYENTVETAHHIAFLTSQFYLSQNKMKKGLLHLISQVHLYPDRPLVRKVLADYLLQNYSSSANLMVSASRIAQSVIALNFLNPIRSLNSSEDGARNLMVASEAMKYVDKKASLMLAQRAVHLNPCYKQAWSVIISCRS